MRAASARRQSRKAGLAVLSPSASTLVVAERIERDIDAVEVAVVGAAILQVVDDLQSRAERVVGRPGGAQFAVHVEDVAPDRHGRQRAIGDELVPVGVAQLGDVKAERIEQVLRVLWRQAALLQHRGELDAFGFVIAFAEQAALEAVEPRELFRAIERRVIGDVVGNAHEFVKGENRRAVPALDQPGGDREILVARALAGAQFAARRHCRLGALT